MICVCKSIITKLVQASNSFFVVRHVGTARRTCRVVSRRDVTSQVEFGLYAALYYWKDCSAKELETERNVS